VPDFDRDWEALQLLVKPGFMIFGNLSTLKAMHSDVKTAQDTRQAPLMQSGMGKICKYCSAKVEDESFLNE